MFPMSDNYEYIIVSDATLHKLGEIVEWCERNGYRLARSNEGKVLGGWSVSFADGSHTSPGVHRISIRFDDITEDERVLLKLRWTGQ